MGVHALKHRAVFLDRDGVINRATVRNGKPYPPARPSELEILPGVAEALCRLQAADFRLIVVTNQPDVARGTQSRETVEIMHEMLRKAGLPITAFYVCYHDGPANCDCRKPRPGLLLSAALDHLLDLKDSYIVGDRWRDIEAGQRAGCRAFFVDCAYDEPQPLPPYIPVRSLAEAADYMLGVSTPEPLILDSPQHEPQIELRHHPGHCRLLPLPARDERGEGRGEGF
jgi:D-glycero-D-manno-heptose 1,7-bisphosphate phosphatase